MKAIQAGWFSQLPFNWFDLVVVAVLVFGLFRGRKRGMSEELLDVFQWLAIVVVSAYLYQPLGKFVAGFTEVGLLLAYVASYLFFALGIKLTFGLIKRMVGEKVVGTDIFGRMEYYLGMLAGMFRYACMAVVVLAVVNAKFISEAELKRMAKLQQDNFGSISFPTFGSIQQEVFQESFSGTLVKKHLGEMLIVPTAPGEGKNPRETIGRRREREVDEVMKSKN